MANVLPEGSRQYRTYWLSFHASYACRRSGACCSSGWDIAIEKARVPAIAKAIDDRRIAAPATWLRRVSGAPDEVAGLLALGESGHCVFHDEDCAIHTALGHAAMPAGCQHFPRVVLMDGRGVFVTLSNYCPTAAAMLTEDDGPVAVVEGPPALPNGDMPEGMDARDALPPLRSPRLLMDLEAYGAWERDTVEALTSSDSPAAVIDAMIGDGYRFTDAELFDVARQCVASPYSWPALAPPALSERRLAARVEGRFLAAHAFAGWMAYEGNGLLSIAIYLRLALAVLRIEFVRQQSVIDAIRQSDLLLRHLVDRETLTTRISAIAAQKLHRLRP